VNVTGRPAVTNAIRGFGRLWQKAHDSASRRVPDR
jgi:hypothetical protein